MCVSHRPFLYIFNRHVETVACVWGFWFSRRHTVTPSLSREGGRDGYQHQCYARFADVVHVSNQRALSINQSVNKYIFIWCPVNTVTLVQGHRKRCQQHTFQITVRLEELVRTRQRSMSSALYTVSPDQMFLSGYPVHSQKSQVSVCQSIGWLGLSLCMRSKAIGVHAHFAWHHRGCE